MGTRVQSMVRGIALGLSIGGSTPCVASASPPTASEAEMDQAVEDLKSLGLAEARLVGDREWPTVVAVGRARFERGGGWSATLNAALVASVEAKAAIVALLEGPEVAAAERIASRLSSSEAEAALVRRFESSVDVAIGGVLAGIEPRGIWIDEEQGLVVVAIQSIARRWSAAREAIASYPSLAAAAEAVARAASEFAIVPRGRLVRIGSGAEARLAVVGIGTSVLSPGKGTRAASLVAGRKAAVAAAAYLKGERVESKDSLSIMLETVERLDPTDRKSGEMQSEAKQRFARTARSLTKGATPQGCETAEAELRILGDRVLVSVLAAPVASDSR